MRKTENSTCKGCIYGEHPTARCAWCCHSGILKGVATQDLSIPLARIIYLPTVEEFQGWAPTLPSITEVSQLVGADMAKVGPVFVSPPLATHYKAEEVPHAEA